MEVAVRRGYVQIKRSGRHNDRNQPSPYQPTVDNALSVLGADSERGLGEDEARVRLKSYGKHELTAEQAVPEGRKFLAQFQSVLVILLLIATGGFVEGSGGLRYAQTMAFTTLVLFQSFNVLNARSDERSAFRGLFSNRWLWLAIILSVALQAVVVYVPLLQRAFSTVGLSLGDWLRCAAVASSVLWLRELSKSITRGLKRLTA